MEKQLIDVLNQILSIKALNESILIYRDQMLLSAGIDRKIMGMKHFNERRLSARECKYV